MKQTKQGTRTDLRNGPMSAGKIKIRSGSDRLRDGIICIEIKRACDRFLEARGLSLHDESSFIRSPQL